ncbi:glycosyltransferase family 52 [Parabacteroides timonensis]|uniref:glycosyltransferase family 52 n=1 Tax=Parabacteroides timonensis TaxID=1871013 RepID=UPI00094E98EA|nr:glycosyltransferase family 52 [Parabacteroides timonensis]
MKLFKRYKAIAYLPNLYSLLQYLLLEPYKKEDTLFFIHDEFPVPVAIRMKNAVFLLNISYTDRIISFLRIHYSVFINRYIPVFLGGDLIYTNKFLSCFTNIFYMEDGTLSYKCEATVTQLVYRKRKPMISRLLYGDLHPWLGLSGNVQKIYLTGILPIPEIIADKVEIIDLKQLWHQKDRKSQEEIKQLFLPADFDFSKMAGYDIFLLTQPFTEFSSGNFSEQQKIEMYRKLLSGYDESKVIIKPHPAERTDYQYYFPTAMILDLCCPFELLFLMGCDIKKAISVDSTAIFNLDDSVEKVISGYDVTPALAAEAKRRGIYTTNNLCNQT